MAQRNCSKMRVLLQSWFAWFSGALIVVISLRAQYPCQRSAPSCGCCCCSSTRIAVRVLDNIVLVCCLELFRGLYTASSPLTILGVDPLEGLVGHWDDCSACFRSTEAEGRMTMTGCVESKMRWTCYVWTVGTYLLSWVAVRCAMWMLALVLVHS